MTTQPHFSRKAITDQLVNDIQSWAFSIACWEGGSAANHRADSFSDLDLVICVEEGMTKEAFARIQNHLESFYKIENTWRVPEPTWHGHGQCFFKLQNMPEYFFLDIVIMENNAQQRFMEKERHGTPIVYFDKCDFAQPSSADSVEFWNKRDRRLETIEDSFPFYKALILKEILRNRPLDALNFYRNLINMLIELYGMKFRPYRYDFGMRYLHSDLPMPEQLTLEKLCFVTDIHQIKENIPKIEALVFGIITELKN